MPRAACLAIAVACIGCREDTRHVFQEPPPKRSAPVAASPLPPSAPEPEFGAHVAEARIAAIKAAATGAPVTLTSLDGTVQVTAMVALGPNPWVPDRNARVELVVTGPTTRIFTRPMEHPAPTILAHNFIVPTWHDSASGLAAGNYLMRVRLIMHDTTVRVESVPLYVTVR